MAPSTCPTRKGGDGQPLKFSLRRCGNLWRMLTAVPPPATVHQTGLGRWEPLSHGIPAAFVYRLHVAR